MIDRSHRLAVPFFRQIPTCFDNRTECGKIPDCPALGEYVTVKIGLCLIGVIPE
jgi:hypothetical protein